MGRGPAQARDPRRRCRIPLAEMILSGTREGRREKVVGLGRPGRALTFNGKLAGRGVTDTRRNPRPALRGRRAGTGKAENKKFGRG